MGDVIDAVVDVVTEVYTAPLNAISTVAEAVGLDAVADLADEVGDAVRWTAQAAKDVTGFLGDNLGMSKEGWLTEFVQDYVPGGGIVTSAVHATAGNFDHAELAAVKGMTTTAVAAGTIASSALMGVAGAILAGAVIGAAATAFESGVMRGLLDPSVKNKIAKLSPEGVLTGAAGGAGGAALGKAVKASRTLQAIKGRAIAAGRRGLRLKPASIGPKTLGNTLKKDAIVKLALSPVRGGTEAGLNEAVLDDLLATPIVPPPTKPTKSPAVKQAKILKVAVGVTAVFTTLILAVDAYTSSGGATPDFESSGVLQPSDKGDRTDVAPEAIVTPATVSPAAPPATVAPTTPPTTATTPAVVGEPTTVPSPSAPVAPGEPTTTTASTATTTAPTASPATSTTATATTTTTTIQQNRAPVANDDQIRMGVFSQRFEFIVANDTDADGDTLTVVAVSEPGRGRVIFMDEPTLGLVGNPTRGVTFRDDGGDPNLLQTTFTYTIEDPSGASSSATVTVFFDETQ